MEVLIFAAMKKYQRELVVAAAEVLRADYTLLRLKAPAGPLPEMWPGQFVQVRADASPSTLLRRPISINFVDTAAGELWLLVHAVGSGTRALCALREGERVDVVLPLGTGFPLCSGGERVLLVGGGVGSAPLLYLGSRLAARGCDVTFLLGGRRAADVLQADCCKRYGRVCITTEDGSAGERGVVTDHSLWTEASFATVYTCGPRPMMRAVAARAAAMGARCYVSLENTMACGLGACLCCVQQTTEGHVCVCTDGPVFEADAEFSLRPLPSATDYSGTNL